MKHFTYPIIIAVFSIVLLSCKKDDEVEPIDPDTGCTNCLPSNATSFNGILKTGTYSITSLQNVTTITSRASAFFSSQPTNVTSAANSITVGAVYINSDTLNYIGGPYYYTNLVPISLAAVTWSVTGANEIPSFTFKNLKENPSYSSIGGLPDTVRKSLGFSFIINDLANSTGASVFLSDGLSTPNVITKQLYLGSDTVMFTPEDLTAVLTSTSAVITLFIENSFAVKVEEKDFKMSREKSYTKQVIIKQ